MNRLSFAGARPRGSEGPPRVSSTPSGGGRRNTAARGPSERLDRLAPKRQSYWDWRAAGNFIGGGTGGSLLFLAALAASGDEGFAGLALAGLALVALGLTCVWLEIGRPWRALNVFRHSATSWMSREAWVAPLMFALGLLAVSFGGAFLVWSSAALGLAFVYSQARLLSADKGIPAWRHRRCLPLVFGSGLAEGAGLLAVLSPWLAPAAAGWLPALLGILLLVRGVVWRGYLGGLHRSGAPLGTLAVLQDFDRPFLVAGHLAPGALLLLGAFASAAPWQALPTALAGALLLAAGWTLKYTLVRRAAYNQGFALPHQPVRGRGTAGQGAKPGWRMAL